MSMYKLFSESWDERHISAAQAVIGPVDAYLIHEYMNTLARRAAFKHEVTLSICKASDTACIFLPSSTRLLIIVSSYTGPRFRVLGASVHKTVVLNEDQRYLKLSLSYLDME